LSKAEQKANAAYRALGVAGTVAAIRANGATSLHAVADELNRQGMATARAYSDEIAETALWM